MIRLGPSDINTKDWIDFSSLSLFWSCPQMYDLRVNRMISSGPKASIINGSAYHECIHTYHQARLGGKSHDDAKVIGLASMVPIFDALTEFDPARNVNVAIETMDAYLERWKDEPYELIDSELGFSVLMEGIISCRSCFHSSHEREAFTNRMHDGGLMCPSCGSFDISDGFVYVGKIDAVKKSRDFGILVNETKSTSIVGNRWQDRLKPNSQIDGYVAAYYLNTGVMPFGAILDVIPVKAEKSKRVDPFRMITNRTVADIEAWYKNVNYWWESILLCRRNSFWPRNTNACQPLVGFNCEYTSICNANPLISAEREIEISSSFTIEEWAPYPELLKKKKEVA